MSKISSSNIFVFPCVSRGEQYDLASKLMSEKNITNIIKSITDEESYIISWVNGVLKCVIKGYYFEISGISPADNMYAHLLMNTANDEILNGSDVSDEFSGVEIDGNSDGADLTLCENGEIPSDRQVKFHTKSLGVDLTKVDCGELK